MYNTLEITGLQLWTSAVRENIWSHFREKSLEISEKSGDCWVETIDSATRRVDTTWGVQGHQSLSPTSKCNGNPAVFLILLVVRVPKINGSACFVLWSYCFGPPVCPIIDVDTVFSRWTGQPRVPSACSWPNLCFCSFIGTSSWPPEPMYCARTTQLNFNCTFGSPCRWLCYGLPRDLCITCWLDDPFVLECPCGIIFPWLTYFPYFND